MNSYMPKPWELLGALHDTCHIEEKKIRVPKSKIREKKEMKLLEFEKRLTDECWKVCELRPTNQRTLDNVVRVVMLSLNEACKRGLLIHVPAFTVEVSKVTREITVRFTEDLKDLWVGEK